MISELLVASTAASVGISPSMAWNVLIQPLSTQSMRFCRTMAEQILTYTSTVRSGGTVRGLIKAPYAWDWPGGRKLPRFKERGYVCWAQIRDPNHDRGSS